MSHRLTVKALAAALEVDRKTVQRLAKRGMPTSSVKDARAWREANLVPRGTRKATGDLNEETTRLRAAQADVAELDAAEKRGELAPVDDYQIAINEAMVIIATQLDGLPGRLAAQLAGMTDAAEIRQLLLNETRRIRASAAARLEDWARLVARGAVDDAAAEPDRGRMGRPNADPAAGKR